tara:strand:- start:375 stop:1034 length:660 start_codon:yes stop_codon:yes gene_type:complete
MKKIQTILISLLFAGFSTFSYADGKMGITITGLDATGKADEMSKGVEHTRNEDVQGVFASFFVEKDLGTATVGLDINPLDIASGSVTNVRSNEGSFNSQTNTAEIEVTENIGVYGILDLGDTGAYVKAMISSHKMEAETTIMNKTTTDTQTNSNYPSERFFGGHLSIGVERDLGDLFIRGEAGVSEYEKVTSKSSSGNTTVTAQIESGIHARISVGRAF